MSDIYISFCATVNPQVCDRYHTQNLHLGTMRDRRKGSTLHKGPGARRWQAVSRKTKRRWASARGPPFSGLALVPEVPGPPSSYPTNRSAADPCTSSKCPRCGTSRTVLKHPFRQLAGGLDMHCQYGFIGRSGYSRTNVLFFPPAKKKC